MSTISTTPLWGQAWELTVQYATSGGTQSTTITTNGWEPEALRITFEVLQSTLPSPWWFADISIYNLNLATIQNTLLNATWVTLKAGFQTGQNLFSKIWDGPILQVLYDRENVVDQRVVLHCVANPLAEDSLVAFAVGPFASQEQLVARMAQQVNLPAMSTGNGTLGQQASSIMSAKTYPRGNTVFGKAGGLMGQIARGNNLQSWRDGYKLYISEMTNPDTQADLVYAPPYSPNSPTNTPVNGVTQSIIGTPRQTPFGVIFSVLLDPRLIVKLPPLVVQLQNTLIQQLSVLPGQTVATPLTQNLTFFVAQVRHSGDSRGNDWHTEVTGYSTTYADNLLNGVFAAGSGT
jgi:hypothetical protein